MRNLGRTSIVALISLCVVVAGASTTEAATKTKKRTPSVATWRYAGSTVAQGGTFKIRVIVKRQSRAQGAPKGFVKLYIDGRRYATDYINASGSAYFRVDARFIGRLTAKARFVPTGRARRTYLKKNGYAKTLTVKPRKMKNLTVEGDSISALRPDGLTPEQRWPQQVARHYRVPLRLFAQSRSGYVRPGGGENGTTFMQRIEQVVATRPDTIIVMGGRNDFRANDTRNTRKGEVEAAAARYIAALQSRLRYTRIVVVGPPWGATSRGTNDVTVRRVYTEIRQAASKQHVEFVETYHGILNPQSLGNTHEDGTHATAQGHQAITRRVLAGL